MMYRSAVPSYGRQSVIAAVQLSSADCPSAIKAEARIVHAVRRPQCMPDAVWRGAGAQGFLSPDPDQSFSFTARIPETTRRSSGSLHGWRKDCSSKRTPRQHDPGGSNALLLLSMKVDLLKQALHLHSSRIFPYPHQVCLISSERSVLNNIFQRKHFASDGLSSVEWTTTAYPAQKAGRSSETCSTSKTRKDRYSRSTALQKHTARLCGCHCSASGH